LEIAFVTDTATLCLFDEEVMRHRLDDAADWWAVPEEELEEVNKGNALFIALGSDGRYRARIEVSDRPAAEGALTARVKCSSGKLFIGPGEDMSGEDVGPNTKAGGVFLDLAPATYEVAVRLTAPAELEVRLRHVDAEAANNLASPLVLTR
jgi:hypothetical protein